MGPRLWIKGTSGAGKSTLAGSLAGYLKVPHVELDALHHGPHWSAASDEQLQARVAAALDDERGWILDGNYDSKLGTTVIDRAESIVWLDLPLGTKLLRLARRTLRRRLRREELWNGNRESLRDVFCGHDALFPWTIRSHFVQRREWPTRFPTTTVIRLKTPAEVDAWFSTFTCVKQQKDKSPELLI